MVAETGEGAVRAEATARIAGGALNAGLVLGMAAQVMALGALAAFWRGVLGPGDRAG